MRRRVRECAHRDRDRIDQDGFRGTFFAARIEINGYAR